MGTVNKKKLDLLNDTLKIKKKVGNEDVKNFQNISGTNNLHVPLVVAEKVATSSSGMRPFNAAGVSVLGSKALQPKPQISKLGGVKKNKNEGLLTDPAANLAHSKKINFALNNKLKTGQRDITERAHSLTLPETTTSQTHLISQPHRIVHKKEGRTTNTYQQGRFLSEQEVAEERKKFISADYNTESAVAQKAKGGDNILNMLKSALVGAQASKPHLGREHL